MTQKRKSIKRILVFRIGELGDTIAALPALEVVRATFPDARITFMGNSQARKGYVSARSVLPENGLVDEWLEYSANPSGRSAVTLLELVAKIRAASFDALIYLAPRIRNKRDVRRDLFFFRCAGITRVFGAKGIEPMPQPGEAVTHEVDHLLERLALDGMVVPDRGKASIDLRITSAEQDKADKWLESHVENNSSPLVAFAPGSKWASKVWPTERYLAVGARLISEQKIIPIVFGGVEDRALASKLIAEWGIGANAAGDLTVRHSAAALKRCVLYVGNDTGTMHLAASSGVRCVGVMSALDWPGHWSPYGTQHLTIRRSVSCQCCLLRECSVENLRCLTDIAVEEVVEACTIQLAQVKRARPELCSRPKQATLAEV